ncbi:MAG: hypothetical protein AAGI71_12255 [Bacteroidota bacterium]
MEPSPDEARANSSFPLGQLARVLATSQDHPDEATRTRAKDRVADWLRVFGGMLSGALHIGSRTPVHDAPAWATPRVIKGGFVTGELLAGGPLRPHEEALLAALGTTEAERGRATLNAFYVTDEGLDQLMERLQTGQYRVDVPEEGALLAVAWLARNGQADAARAVLREIGPYVGRLRFYPVPVPSPEDRGDHVRLISVREAERILLATRTPTAILTEREVLSVWAPFEDRLVELFAETVEGRYPQVVSPAAGGAAMVEGGWPCQVYPEGWPARAQTLLDRYEQLRAEHVHGSRHADPARNLARLLAVLRVAAEDPRALTGRQVGVVRATLAWIAAKRGRPGSAQLRALRAQQAAVASRPTKGAWAEALAHRLADHDHRLHTADLGALLAPVTSDEAEALGVPPEAPLGGAFRPAFQHLLRRATHAPMEQHLAWKTITSGETLAQVVPPLTARIRSAALDDPALRWLDEAVYAAFSRRRSLLLLNLEHQVQLDELPWMRVLEPLRKPGMESRAAARALLVHVVSTALEAFPHQILPNKLLQEVRVLAEAAGLELPLVDEIAADIFMGTFSVKYLRAAQQAGGLLRETLYEHYYEIYYDRIMAIDDVTPSGYGPSSSSAFDRLCQARAPTSDRQGRWGRSIAHNGAVIEQEQVLTTHNLAVLFEALELNTVLEDRLLDLAQRCFVWVCHQVDGLRGPRWGQLRAVKNAAYAWRQMIFFLSLSPDAVSTFLPWAEAHLAERSAACQAGLAPILDGMRQRGNALARHVARRWGWSPAPPPFYGWSPEAQRLLNTEAADRS